MEDGALFIRNVLNTNWTSGNSDGVTPVIKVGYDTNVVTKLRGGGFVNSGDVIYVKEVPNSYTSKPNQIGDNGVRTRTRVNITAFTAASSSTVSPQQHCLKLIKEAERIVRANIKQGTTYDYIQVVDGSNENNVTNNWAKYRLGIELIQMSVTW